MMNKIKYILCVCFLALAVFFGIKDYQFSMEANQTYQQLNIAAEEQELSEAKEVVSYQSLISNRKSTVLMVLIYFGLVFVLTLTAGKQKKYQKKLSNEEANRIADEIAKEQEELGYWVEASEEINESEDEVNDIYSLDAPVITNTELVGHAIKITWEKVPGADGYVVLCKAGEKGWKREKTVGKEVTEYINYRLASNTAYCHSVRAYHDNSLERIVSDYNTDVKEIFVFEGGMCGRLNLQERPAEDGARTIFWDPVDGVCFYTVYRRKEKGKWKKVCRVSSDRSEYTVCPDPNEGAYVYSVAGINRDGKTLIRGLLHEGFLI